MFSIILSILVTVIISFIGGIGFTLYGIKKLNNTFIHGTTETDFDRFKSQFKFIPIDIILDVAFAFGFKEGKESNNVIDCGEF